MNFDDEEQPEDTEATFKFFLELAKPLVLELPSSDDRASAAAWVQRLEKEPETDEEKSLRVDYIKLLLFVMQKGNLLGIFRNEPPEEPLQKFPQGYGLTEMGNHLLDQSESIGNGDKSKNGECYSIEISNDLKEFAAAQEIPDFGVQLYYAWSAEQPIHKWSSFDEKKFPQYVRDKIRQLKMINSDEKTQEKSNSQAEIDSRKSCDSSIHEKPKARVKSPEEIEKCLERNRHSSGNISMGSSKDEDKVRCSRKKYRSNSRKNSPERSPRRLEMEERICNSGLPQENDEGESNSNGGMRICECGHHRTQKMDRSKRLQKCENGGAYGETFLIDGTGSRHRKSCRNAEEILPENPKCDEENSIRERPICPMRLYQMRQEAAHMSMIRSRKNKCPQDYLEDDGKKSAHGKSNSGRPCNVSPPARQPCSCVCPREEKDIACPKKKAPVEKSCHRSTRASDFEAVKAFTPDVNFESHNCKTKGPLRIDYENINHVEGCTCFSSPPRKRLEGLQRLGLGKTTPDEYIMETKTPPTPKNPQEFFSPPPGRRKLHKPIKKLQEELMQASCLKTRPKIVVEQFEGMKKGGSCPPAKRGPSNINSACPQISKRGSLDSRVPPRPIQSEFKPSSCAPQKSEGEMGTCPPQPCKEKNFPEKKYETDLENLQCPSRPPQQQEECPQDEAGKEDKRKERLQAVLQEVLISPCSPKEFVDVFSNSSAEEQCPAPPDCEADEQEAAGNKEDPEKCDACPGENEYEDDGGAGAGAYSSSSENACAADAGQNFEDYEINERQKPPYQKKAFSELQDTRSAAQIAGRPAGQRYSLPYNLGNAPYPTQFQQMPQTFNPPQSQGFYLHYNNENPPCQVPFNSPTSHQPGQPLSAIFPGMNQYGQAPMPSAWQGGCNRPIPEQFQTMPYAAGNQTLPFYNQPQPTYNQMQPYPITIGAGTQAPLYGQQPAIYNQPSHVMQPNACPPRQRQTLDGRSAAVNRRLAHVDPNDFPHSIIEHQEGPLTSTPRSSNAPPPPECFLSPILPHSGQSWSQYDEVPIQKARRSPTQRGGESMINNNVTFPLTEDQQEWMSMKAYKSTMDRTFNSTDPDLRRQRAQCYAENEGTTSSLVCQHGSYEESPGWRELPRSTRFPKKECSSYAV